MKTNFAKLSLLACTFLAAIYQPVQAQANMNNGNGNGNNKNYQNFIREVPVDETLPIAYWETKQQRGTDDAQNPVYEGGTVFELHCIEINGNGSWMLDHKFIDAVVPSIEYSVYSPDPYNPHPYDPSDLSRGGSEMRTRADLGYSIVIDVEGLVPYTDDDATLVTSNVIKHHEYDKNPPGKKREEVSAIGISQDGSYEDDFTGAVNIAASPQDQADGWEYITVYSIPLKYNGNNGHGNNTGGWDPSNPGNKPPPEGNDPTIDDEIIKNVLLNKLGEEEILNTVTMRVFPMPTAAISGLEATSSYSSVELPQVTVDYNKLYPGSDTYTIIRKDGQPFNPSVENGILVKTVQTDSEPISTSNIIQDLGAYATSGGHWHIEVYHSSSVKSEPELLASDRFYIYPRIKVNADINGIQ